MKRITRRFLLIALLLECAAVPPAYCADVKEIRQWIRNPADLNQDGLINHIDLFLLAGGYRRYPTPTPTSTPTPTRTPKPTATPNPAQAHLPPVGEVQEVNVAEEITNISLDFPTAKETYLVIVRNENIGAERSEVGIYSEGQLSPSKAIPSKPSTVSDGEPDTTEYHWHPDVITFPVQIEHEKTAYRKLMAVGDPRSFVLYGGTTVTGTLRYLGTHAAVYVDNNIWMQGEAPVNQSLVDREGAFFDNTTYPTISTVFGAPSDVDKDGHICILFTTAAAGLGGDAFFFSGDLFNRSELDPSFPTNTMEILYVAPPNTPGRYIDDADISGNIAHELQHLINFYYHSLVYGGRNGLHNEEKWLDEGLSHLAEDYVGSALVSNPDRVSRYLAATDAIEILTDYSPNTTQRGGEYLLCRYIADRFGDAVITKLVKTGKMGIENVESGTGTSFSEILGDWSRAVFLSDLSISDDPKLNYAIFAELYQAPGRWWGKPSYYDLDLSDISFFGPLYYGWIPSGGFSYTLFRNKEGGVKGIDLLRISGPKPKVDVIRLPDRFVYPTFIETDFWQGLILDEPLVSIFTQGEPRVISGRSADGQPLQFVKIMWWRSWQTSIGPDQRTYATIEGDRFTATLLFDSPSHLGTWTLALRANGATTGYNATIEIIEP
ncbi:MAG: hypothetical protein ABIH23_23455 [bacterium]